MRYGILSHCLPGKGDEREKAMVYSNEPIRYYRNRRRRTDPIIQWLELSSVMVWFIFMFSLVAFIAAKPAEEGFFYRLFDVSVRGYWDARLLQRSVIISAIQLVISAVSLILNTRRLKRRTDKIYISHCVSVPVSLLMIIIASVTLSNI